MCVVVIKKLDFYVGRLRYGMYLYLSPNKSSKKKPISILNHI